MIKKVNFNIQIKDLTSEQLYTLATLDFEEAPLDIKMTNGTLLGRVEEEDFDAEIYLESLGIEDSLITWKNLDKDPDHDIFNEDDDENCEDESSIWYNEETVEED